MLNKIIQVIKDSSCTIDGSTLVCCYKVIDVEVIKLFFEQELIENTSVEECKNGEFCNLDFSIHKLQKAGFFLNYKQFILNNRYVLTDGSAYVFDKDSILRDSDFHIKRKSIIELIDELKLNSKHIYSDADIDNAIIVREDKSLFLRFDYSSEIIESLDNKKMTQIYSFIDVIKDNDFKDKKNIFLNEFVDFCLNFDEETRFTLIIDNFDSFINKAFSTYDFYLRNFSYNKLKLEIDSKAIEFNQKLQSVINESQTKLIAIPVAFVLVLTSLDYDNIMSSKNIFSIFGLFIFSVLIQIFLHNQKSAIKFIEENIDHYKSTFKKQDKNEVEISFNRVNNEKNKQFVRLILIEVIVWFIPFFTTSILLFLYNYQIVALLIMFFFSWIAINKLLLKY